MSLKLLFLAGVLVLLCGQTVTVPVIPDTQVTLTIPSALATVWNAERLAMCTHPPVVAKDQTCVPVYADLASFVKFKLQRAARESMRSRLPSSIAAHKAALDKAAAEYQAAIEAATVIK